LAHAAEGLPYITFGKFVRTMKKTLPKCVDPIGVTFYTKEASYATFYADGSLKAVQMDPGVLNPIVHYVNHLLQWRTAIECDSKLLGKSIAVTPLFYSTPYSIWTPTTKERRTISATVQKDIEVPSSIWETTFSSSLKYLRCSPPAQVEIVDKEVKIINLPIDSIPFAVRYTEAWLEADESTHECTVVEDDSVQTETVQTNESDEYISKYRRAGYELGLCYIGGVLLMDEHGLYGFLPCSTLKNDVRLRPWVPCLTFENSKDFLLGAARIDAGVLPREIVYNYKGECVGIRTQNQSLVRCKAEKDIVSDHLRRTTEHEILFPNSGFIYGTYCSLVREIGIEGNVEEHIVLADLCSKDFPLWQEGKLLLSRYDLDVFKAQLKHDMTRFHRFRCYILRLQKEINYESYDYLGDEDIIALERRLE
jgi:hypothetical protein